ncbi:MAG: zinc-ribbon domain-containing protein [Acetatifactor sp.]|nr:zinc-ribbon domain-containing protein [Acetatifactor sp.]
MFCTNCGTKLDDDVLFCPNCGTKLAKAQEPAAEPEKPAEAPKPVEEKPVEAAKPVEEEKPAEPEKPAEEVKPAEPAPAPVAPAPVAPVAPAAPAAEPAKPAKEKKAKAAVAKPSGGKVFLSILLCILIFVATVGAGALGVVRMSLTEKNVRDTFGKIDISTVTLPDGNEEVSLVDFLETASGFDFERTAGISKKDLEKFLAKPYIMEEVSNVVVNYLQYFMDGKELEAFSKKDMIKFIEKHNDDILDLTGFSFVYKDPSTGESKVYDVDINNAFKDLGTEEVTIDFIEEKAGMNFGLIKFALSMTMLIILGCVALLLVILVLVINGKTIYSGFSFTGMTWILSGLAIAGCGVFGFLSNAKLHSTLITAFTTPVETNACIVGGGVFVAGLLFFIIGKACKAGARKKQAA